MPRPVLLIRVLLGLLLLLSIPRSATAAGEAIVHGATSLNIRSGAGRDHPSFATLTEGAKVEILAIEGSWAQIRTSDGETGYVHKAFLQPVEAEEAVAEEPAPNEAAAVPAVEEAPAATPAEEADTADPGSEQPPAVDQLVAAQERLERLVEGLRKDVGKVLETTRQRAGNLVGADPIPTPIRVGVTAVDATESGSLLGLSIIGLVVGFILGAIYGRRQERGRRTRVRF